jgi:hypothetical protein
MGSKFRCTLCQRESLSWKYVGWAILQAIGSQGCKALAPQKHAAQRDSQPGRRNVSSRMALHEKEADKAVSQVPRPGITIVLVRLSLMPNDNHNRLHIR